jgi:hypothetical protein
LLVLSEVLPVTGTSFNPLRKADTSKGGEEKGEGEKKKGRGKKSSKFIRRQYTLFHQQWLLSDSTNVLSRG